MEQEKLKKQGIYLVVATKVADNLFVTQLMHENLTVKQQAEIRWNEGEVLITHNPDDYEAAHMHLDPQWLEEQIKLRNKWQENLPFRELEEVQEPTRERNPTETNVAVATSGELVEEPETREDTDEEEEEQEMEEEEEEQEMERETSIGEMLDVMGEDSPHIQMPKWRRLADVEGAQRVSVTREEETTVVEAELSASKKTKATGKNLAAMRLQMAEEMGCKQEWIGNPERI